MQTQSILRQFGNRLFIKAMLDIHDVTIAVVGFGYVGLPLTVQFAKKYRVIGFDINKQKIEAYKSGHDITGEVDDDALKASSLELTSDEKELRRCSFIVVAVPTPTNKDTTPDLFPLIGASTIVGRNLSKGSIVVYESTVYPGVTEDVCLPILEKESGMKLGMDFKIGYSPERINPGDKVHRDPLRDGLQRFALGEPVGDFHPLLEGEVLPMC